MPAWQSGAVARCLQQALPVLWPSEWRVTTMRTGLYLVEANSGDGWWLERMCFQLGDAFALGERLHAAPRRVPELAGSGVVLPETYRIPTGDGWEGSTFRAAVADNPFSLEAGPDEAFRSAAWTRAMQAATRALASGRNVVVAGGAGVGKSLLLRALAGSLRERGVSVCTPVPDEAVQPGVTLIVDAADSWSEESLTALFRTGAQVVLAMGGTGFVAPGAERVALGALSVEEVARFVAGRLRAAGRHATWAEPEALLALASHSGGVVRELIVLAGAATFLADLEHAPRLTLHHAEHAVSMARAGGARLLRPEAPEGRGERARAWLPRAARLGAACAGLALVLAASCGARWVSSRAELARLDEERQGFAELAVPAPAVIARAVQAQENRAEVAAVHPALAQAQPEPGSTFDEPWFDEALGGDVDAHVAVRRAAPHLQAPSGETQAMVSPAALGSFRGAVNNETLQLTGKLAVDLSRDPATGAVRAWFHAWNGLLGTGQLRGTMTADGRVTLTGQLLMGRNPFLCTLTGAIHGGRFTGSAQFVRPWGGRIARSSFDLLRT